TKDWLDGLRVGPGCAIEALLQIPLELIDGIHEGRACSQPGRVQAILGVFIRNHEIEGGGGKERIVLFAEKATTLAVTDIDAGVVDSFRQHDPRWHGVGSWP